MKYLAAGVANAINMFRPEVVVLGGGISNRGEKLAAELNEMVKGECFGHTFVKPAEVVIASLASSEQQSSVDKKIGKASADRFSARPELF